MTPAIFELDRGTDMMRDMHSRHRQHLDRLVQAEQQQQDRERTRYEEYQEHLQGLSAAHYAVVQQFNCLREAVQAHQRIVMLSDSRWFFKPALRPSFDMAQRESEVLGQKLHDYSKHLASAKIFVDEWSSSEKLNSIVLDILQHQTFMEGNFTMVAQLFKNQYFHEIEKMRLEHEVKLLQQRRHAEEAVRDDVDKQIQAAVDRTKELYTGYDDTRVALERKTRALTCVFSFLLGGLASALAICTLSADGSPHSRDTPLPADTATSSTSPGSEPPKPPNVASQSPRGETLAPTQTPSKPAWLRWLRVKFSIELP